MLHHIRRRSAANAGNVVLRVDGGGLTRTCYSIGITETPKKDDLLSGILVDKTVSLTVEALVLPFFLTLRPCTDTDHSETASSPHRTMMLHFSLAILSLYLSVQWCDQFADTLHRRVSLYSITVPAGDT